MGRRRCLWAGRVRLLSPAREILDRQERMEREAAWLKALGEARGFVVSPEGLWLMREDGSVAVCLG